MSGFVALLLTRQPKARGGPGDDLGAPSLGDVAEAPEDKPPLMVDLFCGPNLPLGKAFFYCGWRCLPVDWALDPSHDLSNPQRQDSVREQLQDAVFAAAALDCSAKSRARFG